MCGRFVEWLFHCYSGTEVAGSILQCSSREGGGLLGLTCSLGTPSLGSHHSKMSQAPPPGTLPALLFSAASDMNWWCLLVAFHLPTGMEASLRQGFGLACSTTQPQHLGQGVAPSRCSMNICRVNEWMMKEWVNRWMDKPPVFSGIEWDLVRASA